MNDSWRMNLRSAHRTLLVKLPVELANDRYAAVAYGIHGVLVSAQLGQTTSIIADDGASDDELNDAFDRHHQDFPWGP